MSHGTTRVRTLSAYQDGVDEDPVFRVGFMGSCDV